MGVITAAVEFARTHDRCPGHHFFDDGDGVNLAMSRRALTLIDPNATRQDADEPYVERPARILALNPSGTLQVAYVREGRIVVDEDCPVRRDGSGCCWPLGPAPLPASSDPMEDDLEPGETAADVGHESGR